MFGIEISSAQAISVIGLGSSFFIWILGTFIAMILLFEPAMMNGISLSWIFGDLIGTGPGSGIFLMFVVTGLLGVLASLSAYVFPGIRNAEEILPDYD